VNIVPQDLGLPRQNDIEGQRLLHDKADY